MKKILPCPQEKIEITPEREIMFTDDLQFPYHQDENGYFLVKIENGLICCGFVNKEHHMLFELRGINPDKMIKEITRRNPCSKETLAYIAQEVMIAYTCLINDKKYIQR